MTKHDARKKLNRMLKTRESDYPLYLIWIPEDETYEVADDYDLDGFYAGLPDDCILEAVN